MSSLAQCVYEFGDFQLIPAERLLLRADQPVSLLPKAFDVLVLLVENAGHLVEKETFLRRVWPETFVEEVVLTNAISQVRKVLQNGGETKFIETVPKRGYRFVAEVRRRNNSPDIQVELPEVTAARPPLGEPTPSRARRAPGKVVLLVSLAAVLAISLFAASSLRRPRAVQTVEIRSIAVLPIEDLSVQPGQEYLADGITDELITALAQMKDVRVISRTSTMRYKKSGKALPQIARELNVDGVIEGSLVRSGERVRVRAQLIRAKTDEHVWAQAYERNSQDVLALENELASDIAFAIRSHLPERGAAPIDPLAHELYLKGRYLWNKRDGKSLRLAIDDFQQAIARKKDYAEAYSGIADCYILLGSYDEMPFADALVKAREAAETALKLNEGLAEAHTSLGMIKIYDGWKWEEARKHFVRAIELDPNYATAHHWYGDGWLAPMGKLDEALAELRKAHELDPLSQIIATDIGKELYMARRYDEARVQLEKVIAEEPNFLPAREWLTGVYLEEKKYDDAVAQKSFLYASMKKPIHPCDRAILLARSGHSDEARRLLRHLPSDSSKVPDPGCYALAHAWLGNRREAIALLGEAYEKTPSFMTSLKIWPMYDPLRSDERFAELERRVGLQ